MAYFPERYIREVTRNTYNLFQNEKTNNRLGIAVMVDFKKAFDSVSFDFIPPWIYSALDLKTKTGLIFSLATPMVAALTLFTPGSKTPYSMLISKPLFRRIRIIHYFGLK